MFEGYITALVTPFSDNGSVDTNAYRQMIEHQIASGINGIVTCGTTGETPTLNDDEYEMVLS